MNPHFQSIVLSLIYIQGEKHISGICPVCWLPFDPDPSIALGGLEFFEIYINEVASTNHVSQKIS